METKGSLMDYLKITLIAIGCTLLIQWYFEFYGN